MRDGAKPQGIDQHHDRTVKRCVRKDLKLTYRPPDPILGVTEKFKADTSSKKINLGVGTSLSLPRFHFKLNSRKQLEAGCRRTIPADVQVPT